MRPAWYGDTSHEATKTAVWAQFTVCVHACLCECVCVFVFHCVCMYALHSSDKHSLFLDVAWRTPASDSCRPQQWDQGWFGDIQWQQRSDTEHSLKHKLTQAETIRCNRCRND